MSKYLSKHSTESEWGGVELTENNTPHVALTTDDNLVHYVEKVMPSKKITLHYHNVESYEFPPDGHKQPEFVEKLLDSNNQYMLTEQDLPTISGTIIGWSKYETSGIGYYVGDIITTDSDFYPVWFG